MVVLAFLLATSLVAGSARAQEVDDPSVHVVGRGETLSVIAARHHVSVADLAARNHLREPDALRHNQRLRLPAGAAGIAANPQARSGARHDDPPMRRAGASYGRCGRWGCPPRPGQVSMVRVATDQHIVANLRRPGRAAMLAMRRIMRSTDNRMHLIDPRLARQLAMVSDHFGGRVVEIISGFRPVRAGQYTAHSNHNIGHAIDFRIRGVPNRTLRDFCRTLPDTGCGFYPRSVFVHMDVRSSSAYWVDWSRPGERPRYGREDRPPEDRPRTPARDDTAAAMPPAGADPELDDVIADAPAVRSAAPDPGDEHDDPPTTAP